ncbi:MAG: HAD-IB family hydrolase [Algicola sp.]|nr:HAD-IB family hydrolase [Algicola sp.]
MSNQSTKELALFDFDGTITTKDTLVDFIQYAVGKPAYYAGLLWISPVLVGFVLKMVRNDDAKQKMLGHFFGGWPLDKFQAVADRYSSEQIDRLIRPKALAKIQWHQRQGHEVAIVSASMENWLSKWCEKHSLKLICTKMDSTNNQISGKFDGKNCHGAEKVNRVKAVYNLEDFDTVHAYGDSSGDKQMLAMADEGHYRLFE